MRRLCAFKHIVFPVLNLRKVHDASIVVVLSNPQFITYMSVEISEGMSVIIPSSETRIQASPKDHFVIDNDSLIMMGPEDLVLEFEGIFEEIMVRVSHDANHILVDFFECCDGVFRVHCCDERNIVVDYTVDLDASSSGSTKTAVNSI